MPVSASTLGKAHQLTERHFVQVHPTGRYNFNTLLEILKYDYDLPLVHSTCSLDHHSRPYPSTDCMDTSFQSARPANFRRNDLRIDRRCVEEARRLVRRSTQSRGRRQEGIRSTLPGRVPEVSLPQLSSLSLAMNRTNPIPSVVTRSSARNRYSPLIVRSASMSCTRRDGCVCHCPGVRLYCTHPANYPPSRSRKPSSNGSVTTPEATPALYTVSHLSEVIRRRSSGTTRVRPRY